MDYGLVRIPFGRLLSADLLIQRLSVGFIMIHHETPTRYNKYCCIRLPHHISTTPNHEGGQGLGFAESLRAGDSSFYPPTIPPAYAGISILVSSTIQTVGI